MKPMLCAIVFLFSRFVLVVNILFCQLTLIKYPFSVSLIHKLGVMNPPVLIDLTNDGTVDMVIAFFNSTVAAIDGESFKIIWSYSVPNSESYS